MFLLTLTWHGLSNQINAKPLVRIADLLVQWHHLYSATLVYKLSEIRTHAECIGYAIISSSQNLSYITRNAYAIPVDHYAPNWLQKEIC